MRIMDVLRKGIRSFPKRLRDHALGATDLCTLTEDLRMLSGVRRQEGRAMRQGGSLRIADSMA